uniref:C3H1-type domain-containing protein n=1 Tax=Araucaria cunninghamii TaxID=56994 RepID=A0A0D6R3W9_ARACU
MDPLAPIRKRARPEAFLSENGGGFGDGSKFKPSLSSLSFGSQPEKESLTTSIGSKKAACTKFFSTSGCPYGENCHFSHYVPGGVNAIDHMTNLGSGLGAASKKTTGVLPSDQTFPPSSYKTRLCSNYSTAEGCRFGDKCHFAHGEKELGKGNLLGHDLKNERTAGPLGNRLLPGGLDGKLGGRYREATPPAAATFGLSSTAKISVDASLAGAIIGKGGVNSKQICRITGAKLAIRDHDSNSNLKNIELEGTFEQIQQASAMVRELIMHTSAAAPAKQSSFPTNNYKTKLCENYAQGTCTFGDRCHFAHGTSELRDTSKHA